MEYESASFIAQLNVNLPTESATVSTYLALQIRMVKRAITTTLGSLNSEVSAGPAQLNRLAGLTSDMQAQINTLKLTRLPNMSASVEAALRAMSAGLATRMAEVSATLNATLLDVSATAVNTIRWDGAQQFVQTATPSSPEVGALWFVPEHT